MNDANQIGTPWYRQRQIVGTMGGGRNLKTFQGYRLSVARSHLAVDFQAKKTNFDSVLLGSVQFISVHDAVKTPSANREAFFLAMKLQ